MNIIDYLIIAIIAVSTILGLYWGIIRQVLSLVGLVAGIVLASRYAPNVSDWLSSFISDARVTNLLGFILVLIAVSTLASLIASVLHRFVGLLFLGWADHLLGGIIGAVQGALLATVLIAALAANPNEAITTALHGAQYAARLVETFGFVLTLLPESIRSGVEIFFGGL